MCRQPQLVVLWETQDKHNLKTLQPSDCRGTSRCVFPSSANMPVGHVLLILINWPVFVEIAPSFARGVLKTLRKLGVAPVGQLDGFYFSFFQRATALLAPSTWELAHVKDSSRHRQFTAYFPLEAWLSVINFHGGLKAGFRASKQAIVS